MKEQQRGGKGVEFGSTVGALPVSCMGTGCVALDVMKLTKSIP